MTKDHIIARALGGKNTMNNYEPMCNLCNLAKGTTVDKAQMDLAVQSGIILSMSYSVGMPTTMTPELKQVLYRWLDLMDIEHECKGNLLVVKAKYKASYTFIKKELKDMIKLLNKSETVRKENQKVRAANK